MLSNNKDLLLPVSPRRRQFAATRYVLNKDYASKTKMGGEMHRNNNVKAVILSVLIVLSSVVPSDANDSHGYVFEFLQRTVAHLSQNILHGVHDLFTP